MFVKFCVITNVLRINLSVVDFVLIFNEGNCPNKKKIVQKIFTNEYLLTLTL